MALRTDTQDTRDYAGLLVDETKPAPPRPDVSNGSSRLHRLTRRQRQVLEGVWQGRSNDEIAEQLGMRPRTVGVHLTAMLTLYTVSNRWRLLRAVMNDLDDAAGVPRRTQQPLFRSEGAA